jgi:hypothetical protein
MSQLSTLWLFSVHPGKCLESSLGHNCFFLHCLHFAIQRTIWWHVVWAAVSVVNWTTVNTLHSLRIIQDLHTEKPVMYDWSSYSSLKYNILTSCKCIVSRLKGTVPLNMPVLYCTLPLVSFVCVCVCVHMCIYVCVCVCVREREREVSESFCVYNAGAVMFVYLELWSVMNIKSSKFALTDRLMITYCSWTKGFYC